MDSQGQWSGGFSCSLPALAICLGGPVSYLFDSGWVVNFCQKLSRESITCCWGVKCAIKDLFESFSVAAFAKVSNKGEVSRGVCLTWVNCLPASTKQACSSSVFLECSCHLPMHSSGATTMDKGWFAPIGFRIRQTFWADFLMHSMLQSCFHKDFFGWFHALDWVAISCAIHVSHRVSSFFSHQNCLCAWEICSSRVCCVYSPGCGTVGRPALLACIHNIDRPTFPPFSHFKRLFQNRILLMAAVILGHHWMLLHLSFWHWVSTACFALVIAWSMLLSSIWYWWQRSDGCCRVSFSSASCWGMFWVVNLAHKASLYWVVTWGSLHCKCCADGHVKASWLCGHTCGMSKSTQIAWWSLRTASPNPKYPPAARSRSCGAAKIDGRLPLWKVGGASAVLSHMTTLTRSSLLAQPQTRLDRMSSL